MSKIASTPLQKHYAKVHYWLRKTYGKADKCQSLKCTGVSKIYNYALIRDKTYEKVRKNFKLLCRSCHSKYDITVESREKMRISRTGKKMLESTKKKLSVEHIESGIHRKKVVQISRNGSRRVWSSITSASRYLGIWRTGISNCLNHRAKSAKGFKWEYLNKCQK